MQNTLHYNFPLFEGEDIPSIIESWNPTMAALDAKLYALSMGNAGPEIIDEITRLIQSVNDLIAVVNDVIANVDNVQDTVNGLQRNVNTLFNSVRNIEGQISQIIADMPDISGIEEELSQLSSSLGDLTTTVGTLNGAVTSMQGNISGLDTRVQTLENAPGYSLPTASTNDLGGVKVGIGLSIDANGVLSNDNPTPATPYVLPIADQNTLGGIKVGQNLTIEQDGTLNATGGGGQQLTDEQIGCKSLIYQIRKDMEVDGLRGDYNIRALYSRTGTAHFGLAPENVSEDRKGAFALDVELQSLNVQPTGINAVFSIEPNNDLGAYISYQLRAMKRNATLIDGTFHTDASDNTPTMISGLGMYEKDWQTPDTYVFRPYCDLHLGWYDLVQSGDLTNDQFQLLQNAVYQYTKPYQQELFRFGFGSTNNPNSPRVILCIVADVHINMGGIILNLGIKYSSDDLTNSPSVFPDGYTKPSDYVKTPVYNDVGSTERQTSVALGALDGASALLDSYASIAMVGTPSSFSVSNVVLDQAWFNLILAEGNAVSD